MNERAKDLWARTASRTKGRTQVVLGPEPHAQQTMGGHDGKGEVYATLSESIHMDNRDKTEPLIYAAISVSSARGSGLAS